jgi:hypothetical protein
MWSDAHFWLFLRVSVRNAARTDSARFFFPQLGFFIGSVQLFLKAAAHKDAHF